MNDGVRLELIYFAYHFFKKGTFSAEKFRAGITDHHQPEINRQ